MSVVDGAGFTWDLGGHVVFSHYRYFDRLMTAALGDAWIDHAREAWVWIRDRWVAYPFQNNIWRLPDQELSRCLEGLDAALKATEVTPPVTFADWLQRRFGDGMCEIFMYPYNTKVWAYPPSILGARWMGERVAPVDAARVLRNLVEQRDDVGWGPNARFRFPLRGGTGAIWESIARQLPSERVVFDKRVVRIESRARLVHFADGEVEPYDKLISTMPIDLLLRLLADCPDLSLYADRFVHSSSHIVGCGMVGAPPAVLRTKCWMYFPEPDTPFYRVTVFSNYSPYNVPSPGEHWSLLAEISESPFKPVDQALVIDETIRGFRTVGLIDDTTEIVTRFHRRLEHGYPTPWLEREDVLREVLPSLHARDILSRGRFGAWRYEVSNQDHSALQGVEAVDHLLAGSTEHTLHGRMGVEPVDLAQSG